MKRISQKSIPLFIVSDKLKMLMGLAINRLRKMMMLFFLLGNIKRKSQICRLLFDKSLSLCFSFLVTPFLANTQSFFWDTYQNIGGMGSETVDVIASDATDAIYISGTYNGDFNIQNNHFDAYGDNDIFLAKLQADGELLWLQTSGSMASDEFEDMHTNLSGDSYVTGTYLNEGFFQDTTLIPTIGSRAIFLNKYDANGYLQWARSIDGTGEKRITALTSDQAGYIYLTGVFDGELYIEDTLLTAATRQHLFLMKMDANGQLIWVQHTGNNVQVIPEAIAINEGNNFLMVSGTYKGVLNIAQDTFQTNTSDFDVFIAQFDADTGNPIWGRKAGGVYDDNNSSILIHDDNTIYVLGDFAGVMTLNDDIQIETNGIQDNNLYILAYDIMGTPLWAKSLGAGGFEYLKEAAFYNEDKLALAGYYRNNFAIDTINIDALGVFDSYVLMWDIVDQKATAMYPIASNDIALCNTIHIKNEDLLIGGSFSATAYFDEQPLISEGLFDGFIANLTVFPTTTINTTIQNQSWTTYPNPVSDILYIDGTTEALNLQLYNAQGLLLGEFYTKNIDVTHLAAGIYFLKNKNSGQSNSFIKQ